MTTSTEHGGQHRGPACTDASPADSTDLETTIPGASACALVVVAADSGRVLTMGSAAERLSGFAREEVVGRPVWETLVPEGSRQMVEAAATACVSAGTPMNVVGPLRTADGGTRQVEWFAAPLVDPETGDAQVLFFADDGPVPGGAGQLFAHLMHNAADTAVLTTDHDGVVTFVSTGAADLFGLAPGELVGAPFPLGMLDADQVAERAAAVGLEPGLRLLLADPTAFERREPGPDLGDLDRRRRDAATRPPVRTTEWRMRRTDGRIVTVAVSTRPLHDHHGRVVGHLSVGEDVTESRATQALLVSALRAEREAVTRLRELDRAKDEFVATVSHELRTPMTNILGYLELLREGGAGALTSAQAGILDVVGRNADRLRALADDLLVLLGLETEHPSPQHEPVDVRSVLLSLRDAVPSLVAQRRLDVDIEVPTQPVVVRGDQQLLEHALRNLLSNAVKFTEDGGRVTLSARASDDAVAIEVADDGIGIGAEDRGRVFGRFTRARQAQERAVPGAGLGLCIVEAIVREHQGQVYVESEPGEGSVFTVVLPRACSRPVEVSA